MKTFIRISIAIQLVLLSCATFNASNLTATTTFGNGTLFLIHGNKATSFKGTREKLFQLVDSGVRQPSDPHLLLYVQHDARHPHYVLCVQTEKGTWQKVDRFPLTTDELPFSAVRMVNKHLIEVYTFDDSWSYVLKSRIGGNTWIRI